MAGERTKLVVAHRESLGSRESRRLRKEGLIPGVLYGGGELSQPLRELNVEALPLEVPEHLDLDVSHMAVNDTLRIADVVVPAGVMLLDDPETVVATVTAPTREVEPEPVEGEEVEGEEV